MDYSPSEQLLLGISQVALEIYHAAMARPRAFWGLSAVACGVAAILLLRPSRTPSTAAGPDEG